jgi:hypothetical protein
LEKSDESSQKAKRQLGTCVNGVIGKEVCPDGRC